MITWTLILFFHGYKDMPVVPIPGFGSKALCEEAWRDFKKDGAAADEWTNSPRGHVCLRVIGPEDRRSPLTPKEAKK